ncbi:hypothetical protein NDU88_004403 [Pleurodeles waltl]|uniref:Reverse transcriptase domain-containing protein n=1 Tax=Pleurodeles waltl TaxID=8319 RepID=A0AAV7TRE8_PLEWA|nr:hypothetical protein NDU88_004403 [Pleurodeles waltl]
MAPLANIARSDNLNIISYADDTQLILSLTKDSAKTNLQEGMKAIAEWMKSSCLKLNPDKTEVLIFSSTLSAWDDSWWPTAPTPTDLARSLGFILDSSLSMTQQVNAISSSCFNTLRMLRKIYKWIPTKIRSSHRSPRKQQTGLQQCPLCRNHGQIADEAATHPECFCTPHPGHPSPLPHHRPTEKPALAPSQQENHLQTPHPRSQSNVPLRTRIPQHTALHLHPDPASPLRRLRPSNRPTRPQNYNRR